MRHNHPAKTNVGWFHSLSCTFTIQAVATTTKQKKHHYKEKETDKPKR